MGIVRDIYKNLYVKRKPQKNNKNKSSQPTKDKNTPRKGGRNRNDNNSTTTRNTTTKRGVNATKSKPQKKKKETKPSSTSWYKTTSSSSNSVRDSAYEAYKKGQNVSGLGTKVGTHTLSVKNNSYKEDRKKAKAEYDKSYNDTLKSLNNSQKREKAYYEHQFRAKGYDTQNKAFKKELNDSIDSGYKEAYKKLSDERKKAHKDIDKSNPKSLKSTYKDLSRSDYGKMTTASMTGQLQNLMKSDKKLAKKVADVNVKDYVNSKFAMGMLDQMTQGQSVSNDKSYKYSEQQKKIMEKSKESKAYMGGRFAGGAAEFALGGTGAMGSTLAKTGGKQALRTALKEGGKSGLRSRVLKNIAKETVADAGVSLPLNTLDAVKDSYVDGKLDKSTFLKSLGANVAGDVLLGGGISGITHGVGGKKAVKFDDIVSKMGNNPENIASKNRKFIANNLDSYGTDIEKADFVLSNKEKSDYVTLKAKKSAGTISKAERGELKDLTVKINKASSTETVKRYGKGASDAELSLARDYDNAVAKVADLDKQLSRPNIDDNLRTQTTKARESALEEVIQTKQLLESHDMDMPIVKAKTKEVKPVSKKLEQLGVKTKVNVVTNAEAKKKLKSIGKDIDDDFDGFVLKNEDGTSEIYINASNKNADPTATVIGHEVAHLLEKSTDGHNNVKILLRDIVGDKEYETEVAKCKKLYDDVEGADAENEAVANLIGRMFSTDNDGRFLRDLANKDRTLFDKIHDFIKKLKGEGETKLGNAKIDELDNLCKKILKERDGTVETKVQLSLKNKNLKPTDKIKAVQIESKDYINVSKNDYGALELLKNEVRNIQRGVFENTASGYKAKVTRETINKALNPAPKINPWSNNSHYIDNLNAIRKLKDLFENAVYLDSMTPRKLKNQGKQILEYHYFVAPLKMNGSEYRAVITARGKRNSDTLYALNIEVLPIKNGSSLTAGQKPTIFVGNHFDEITISDLVNNVKLHDYLTGQNKFYSAGDIKYKLNDSKTPKKDTSHNNDATNEINLAEDNTKEYNQGESEVVRDENTKDGQVGKKAVSTDGRGKTNIRKTDERVSVGEGRPTGRLDRPTISEELGTSGVVSESGISKIQRTNMAKYGIADSKLSVSSSSAIFSESMERAVKNNKFGGAVDIVTPKNIEDYGIKTFLSSDKTAGFGIKKDGDIVALFKDPNSPHKGFAYDALVTARANGGNKMDCYGIKLVRKYERAGFIPVARVPFNAEYVSDKVLLDMKPDVYVMMKNTDNLDTVIEKVGKNGYIKSFQSDLDKLPTFEDYDEALAYRDKLLAEQENKSTKPPKSEKSVVAYDSIKHGDLRVQTMYISNKKSLATPTSEQADVNTPKAGSGTASFSDNISSSSQKINSKVKESISNVEKIGEIKVKVDGNNLVLEGSIPKNEHFRVRKEGFVYKDKKWQRPIKPMTEKQKLELIIKENEKGIKSYRSRMMNTKNLQHKIEYSQQKALLETETKEAQAKLDALNGKPKKETKVPESPTIKADRTMDIQSTKESIETVASDVSGQINGKYDKFIKALHDSRSNIANSISTIQRNAVNSFAELERLATKLPRDERAPFRARINNMRIAKNKASAWILDGVFTNGKTRESLKSIYKDLMVKGKEKELADFNEYLLHSHNIDRAKIDKPVFWGVSSEESAQIVKELDNKYPNFKNRQARLNEYTNALMDYRVETGLVSKDTADLLESIYSNYVPTYRVMDGKVESSATNSNVLKMNEPIKKAIGGDREIIPVHKSLDRITRNTIIMGEQNEMFRALAMINGSTEVPKGANLKDALDTTMYATRKDGKYYANFYDDGVLKQTEINKQIYDGMMEWHTTNESWVGRMAENDLVKTAEPLLKGIKGANKVFKDLITGLNPIFGTKNLPRDTIEGLLNTKNLVAYVRNYPLACSAVIKKGSRQGEWAKLYKMCGGEYTQLRTSDIEQILKPDSKLKKASPIEWCKKFNDSLESVPRIAEFMGTLKSDPKVKMALKEGKSMEEVFSVMDKSLIDRAMYSANEVTLNFGRSGALTKIANSTAVPYLNPAVQGLDKVFRNCTEDGIKGFMSFGMKCTAFAVAPAVLNEIMNNDDPNYRQLNMRDKMNNFMIPIGEGKFIKFPKSRMGAFVSAPEQALAIFLRDAKVNNEDGEWKNTFVNQLGNMEEWKEVGKIMWDAQGVQNPSTNNLFAPIFGVKNNKTWYGGNIEDDSQYSEDVKNRGEGKIEEIYDATTSGISKWISAHGANKAGFSPKQIDYLIDSYTGVIGDFAIPMTSEYSNGNPLMKNYITDSVFSNHLAIKFWGDYTKKMDEGDKSPKKKDEANLMFNDYGNAYISYSSALEDLKSKENLDRAEKNEKVRQVKELQNELLRAYESGKSINKEPLAELTKIYGKNMEGYVLRNFLPESIDRKTGKVNKTYSYKQHYEDYKNSIGYSELNKAQKIQANKDFLTVYSKATKAQTKYIKQYGNEPNWDVMSVQAYQSMTKKYGEKGIEKAREISMACGGYESSQEKYQNYVANGGTANEIAKATGTLTAGKKRLEKNGADIEKGSTYDNTSKYGADALFLARSDKKYLDRVYTCKGTYENKMHAARGLAEEYKNKWTTTQFVELADKANTDNDRKISEEEAVKAIDNSKAKDNKEKAYLYILMTGSKGYNTPYGTVDKHSIDGDTGYTNDGGSGRGGRRRGRRRGGHGGGGGGSAKSATDWYKYYEDLTSVKSTGTKSSAQVKYKSPLTESYRRRQNKLQVAMRKS